MKTKIKNGVPQIQLTRTSRRGVFISGNLFISLEMAKEVEEETNEIYSSIYATGKQKS